MSKNKKINKSVYIIAEIGNTHEGSIGLAKRFIKAAFDCGVDAVKMQTHIFESESLPDAPNPPYFTDETREEYFKRTAFTVREWKELKRYSQEDLKIDFFSSPFSLEAVEVLEEIDIGIYKVASGEVTNIPLLKRIARTGKKVILSSGMSDWAELDEAVNTLQSNGCKDLTVLQCTSEYPCPPNRSGLNVLNEIRDRYKNIKVGYSDHTLGVSIAIAAVAMGADLIEKHFTLSKKMYGSDAANAIEPQEFKRLVGEIRNVEVALHSRMDKNKRSDKINNMKLTFEKSIVSAKNIEKNTIIELDMLAYKKPGDGISAKEYNKVAGKKIKKSVSKNYKFEWSDFSL
jgi:N,N'-diacetyllegionaminate synthase